MSIGLLGRIPAPRGHYLTPDASARFWPRVNEYANEQGCWRWTGGCFATGMGAFVLDGKTVVAARVAWLDAGRPLEDGVRLNSTCGNGWCMNPDHRETGKRFAKPRRERAPRETAPAELPAPVYIAPPILTLKDAVTPKGCECAACRLLDQPGAASIRFEGGATIITPDGQTHQGDTLSEAVGIAAGVVRAAA